MNFSTIPLVPNIAQTLTVPLGGVPYNLTVTYRNCAQGGWVLDIADSDDNAILQGIPLVAGADLLAQYAYLGFGGQLGMYNGQAPNAGPTLQNLGVDCLLYWVTP